MYNENGFGSTIMFTSAFSRLSLTLPQRAHKRSLLSVLVLAVSFFGAASIAPAQVKRQKPPPTESLEKYGDPPALFPATGLSPGMLSVYDGFASHQVNVNANGMNITGDAANEPRHADDSKRWRAERETWKHALKQDTVGRAEGGSKEQ